jgi:hypothetical protein
LIYLHETRGADLAITAAIDEHVKSARDRDGDGVGVTLAFMPVATPVSGHATGHGSKA